MRPWLSIYERFDSPKHVVLAVLDSGRTPEGLKEQSGLRVRRPLPVFEAFDDPFRLGVAANNNRSLQFGDSPKAKQSSASSSDVNSSCQPSKLTVKPVGVIRKPTLNPELSGGFTSISLGPSEYLISGCADSLALIRSMAVMGSSICYSCGSTGSLSTEVHVLASLCDYTETGIIGNRRVLAADEPLHWIGSSKRDFLSFPARSRKTWETPSALRNSAAPRRRRSRGRGSVRAAEVVESHEFTRIGGLYGSVREGVYSSTRPEEVASGIRTAKRDVDLVAERLKTTERDYEDHHGKQTLKGKNR